VVLPLPKKPVIILVGICSSFFTVTLLMAALVKLVFIKVALYQKLRDAGV